MTKIQVRIKNTFSSSKKNSDELGINVYKKVFTRLIEENRDIGKIFPIYVEVNGISRILGIFALNKSGSASFFPELIGNSFFDHITFSKNPFKNQAHITRITDHEHIKVSSLLVEKLSNATYHVITFVYNDFSLLKLTPEEIIYPPVEYSQQEELKNALFTNNEHNGCFSLKPLNDDGSLIIQMFLIPIRLNFDILQFTTSPLKNFSEKIFLEELKKRKQNKFFFEHPFNNQYKFGFVSFMYPVDIKAPAFFSYSIDNSNFYFNSMDEELNLKAKKIHKMSCKK